MEPSLPPPPPPPPPPPAAVMVIEETPEEGIVRVYVPAVVYGAGEEGGLPPPAAVKLFHVVPSTHPSKSLLRKRMVPAVQVDVSPIFIAPAMSTMPESFMKIRLVPCVMS